MFNSNPTATVEFIGECQGPRKQMYEIIDCIRCKSPLLFQYNMNSNTGINNEIHADNSQYIYDTLVNEWCID